MANSNLYVERIFEEHPVGLWSLDDDISYRNILTEPYSIIGSDYWNSDGNPSFTNYNIITPDFGITNRKYTNFYANDVLTSFTYNSTINIDEFNPLVSTATISIVVMSHIPATIEIGAIVDSVEQTTTYTTGIDSIVAIHEIDLTGVTEIIPIIKTTDNVWFQISSVTVAQWAEQYLESNLGYIEESVPSDIAYSLRGPSNYNVIYADEYGLRNEFGYYLVSASTHNAYVKPSGIPLVYGSNNAVTVYQAESNPSIIVPGRGMLNQAGKYGSYTLEAWVRFHNNSADPIRLIGPLNSTDGIYVEEGFLSLYVGPYTKSYFVGKFDRPMLLDMEYSPTRCSLMINGEQVIDMPIDINNITFPNSRNSSGSSLDWIGVYGSKDVQNFDIDSIAIFPYLVPPEIAKRHFVFGQGVQNIDFSNEAFSATTIQIDYPFAQYAYNVSYPGTTRWLAGNGVNADTTKTVLKPNTYKLPQIVVVDSDGNFVSESDWFKSNYESNNEIFPSCYIKPNGGEQVAYLYFDSLNPISDRVKSILFFGRSYETAYPDQTILRFNKTVTGEHIDVVLDYSTLRYSYSNLSSSTTLYEESVSAHDYFVAGIDIPALSASFNYVIGNFFSDPNRITLNVGGFEDKIFEGKLFALHFTNKFFHDRNLVDRFSNGIAVQPASLSDVSSYIGNYSLLPTASNTTMKFDIGEISYWEDFLPLSMFAKKVNSASASFYDLDFLQFNIDIPYGKDYGLGAGTYYYYQLIQLEDLNNHDYAYFNTLYPTYGDIVPAVADVMNSLRYSTGFSSYITLQPGSSVGTNLYSSYDLAGSYEDNVVSPSDLTKKYQVYDNSIIMIPDDIDFNEYYIGIHLEMLTRGTVERAMFVRKMELSSFAANDGVPTQIGTKFAYPVYPEAS